MTGIVCLDQEDGLLFNGRRQSRDRVVTEKILSMTEGKPLWMSAYSRRIFPEDAPVCVAEAKFNAAEDALRYTEIKAPFDCFIPAYPLRKSRLVIPFR